ncbi:ABC transporter permease [Peptoniphilaceae bacterium SGI.137]|nr:ABC transporter permease [Peptoniphilaceae bacterium]MDY4195656.1 ABC transporter permease [Peptoniphilaceae bacterium]MDY5842442.1 ABC transporter permease [Peptoniphilaceae bacterium]MDY6146659.1 ABC transporter permease [Peptoniphilaceae bacterium]
MSKWIKRIYLTIIYLFLYAPIMVLIVFSFNEGKTRGAWDGFSLRWYHSLFQNDEIMQALYNSISIALIATLCGTMIATLGVLGFYQFRRRGRKATLMINQVIVLNPDIVTAVGFMTLFGLLRMQSGYWTLLLSHIAFVVPYVVLSVLPKMETMSKALPEAAMDLGATPWQTLWHVVLPALRGGIVSGALMGFTMSIDDFVISFFNTGNGVETISTMVYSMARRGINPEVNALSTLMFGTMLILLVAMNLKSLGKESE